MQRRSKQISLRQQKTTPNANAGLAQSVCPDGAGINGFHRFADQCENCWCCCSRTGLERSNAHNRGSGPRLHRSPSQTVLYGQHFPGIGVAVQPCGQTAGSSSGSLPASGPSGRVPPIMSSGVKIGSGSISGGVTTKGKAVSNGCLSERLPKPRRE